MNEEAKYWAKILVPAVVAASAVGVLQQGAIRQEAEETHSRSLGGIVDNSFGIPGTLFKSKKGSDVLVMVVAGMQGKQKDYQEVFAVPLAKDYNVYTTQLRDRGNTFSDKFPDDFRDKEREVRRAVAPNKVVYIGHSAGFSEIISAVRKHGLRPDGVYGISPFPSVGDMRTESPDLTKKSSAQKTCEIVDEIMPIGPFGAHLGKIPSEIPVRLAIPENDEMIHSQVKFNPFDFNGTFLPLTYKKRPEVKERFVNYFKRQGMDDIKIFSGRNHNFNYRKFDWSLFNRDNPKELVDDAREFIRKVTRR